MNRCAWVIVLGLVGPLTASAREQILKNPSFEHPPLRAQLELDARPAEWDVYSTDPKNVQISLTTTEAKKDKQSVRFKSDGAPATFNGLYQSFHAEPGEVYEFQLYARMDPHAPLDGTQRGEMRIEFLNGMDVEISRVPGPEWRKKLSANKWTKYKMEATVPEGATVVRFVISQNDGLEPASAGRSFLVDNVSVERKR